MPRWEALDGTIGVYTAPGFGFTTDSLLLADFSRPKPGEACADLGTGCGVIPMTWKSRGKPGPVLAVELQEEGARLAALSAERSGFSGDEVRVVWGDVREYRQVLPRQKLDLIACNPPYYPLGSGKEGEGPRGAARHDGSLTLCDLAAAAKWGLRWGGRLCVCLRTERMAEAMEIFRQNGMEPKRLRLVQSGAEKPPYLFLLECRYGGRPGLSAEPTLILKPGERLFN